jgi:hypothetical protein
MRTGLGRSGSAIAVALAGCSIADPQPPCTARPLVELNSPAQDRSPWLSSDALEIYFSSNRTGDSEIYRAIRGSLLESFSAPAIEPSLSSPDLDFDPFLSDDELTAWTWREATGMFRYHRSDRELAFDAPPAANDRDPAPQRGGHAIAFATDRPGGQGDLDLWIACE